MPWFIVFLVILFIGCGGDGGNDGDKGNNNNTTTTTIEGTVSTNSLFRANPVTRDENRTPTNKISSPTTATQWPFSGKWSVEMSMAGMADPAFDIYGLNTKFLETWEIFLSVGEFKIIRDGQQLNIKRLKYNDSELSFYSESEGYIPGAFYNVYMQDKTQWYFKLENNNKILGQYRTDWFSTEQDVVSGGRMQGTANYEVNMVRIRANQMSNPRFPTVQNPTNSPNTPALGPQALRPSPQSLQRNQNMAGFLTKPSFG